MAMNHNLCNHPKTPADRARCRAARERNAAEGVAPERACFACHAPVIDGVDRYRVPEGAFANLATTRMGGFDDNGRCRFALSVIHTGCLYHA